MNSPDVIVLGLGGMGSAAAYHLAARGRRVLGLEQFTPAHHRGASHGATRIIRQNYFEHPSYVPLLLRAYELWRELEQRTGKQLLQLTGGLMLGSPDSDVIRGCLQSARQHGLAYEFLNASQIRQRVPPFCVTDDTVGIFEQAGGFLRCEDSVAAHLTAAAAAGADLHFEEPVTSVNVVTTDRGVTVGTARGTYQAEQLVITPGPWAPGFLEGLGVPLEVTRQVMFWLQPKSGVKAFQPDRFPVWIREGPGGDAIYGFPAVDGPEGGVKVALHHKPRVEICTPDSIDRTIREDDEADLRAALRGFVSALDGDVVKAATCLYTTTPDSHFVICAHPKHPQVQIACGFSGHGFKFCSVVGEILADLATTGNSRHDLSLFSPARFSKPQINADF